MMRGSRCMLEGSPVVGEDVSGLIPTWATNDRVLVTGEGREPGWRGRDILLVLGG